MIAQFGPYNWVQFEWRPLSSLGRWCATLVIVFLVRTEIVLSIDMPNASLSIKQFLLTELNTFYLKVN